MAEEEREVTVAGQRGKRSVAGLRRLKYPPRFESYAQPERSAEARQGKEGDGKALARTEKEPIQGGEKEIESP